MEKGVSPFSSLSESFPTATVKLGSLPGTAQDDEQGQNLPLPLRFMIHGGKMSQDQAETVGFALIFSVYKIRLAMLEKGSGPGFAELTHGRSHPVPPQHRGRWGAETAAPQGWGCQNPVTTALFSTKITLFGCNTRVKHFTPNTTTAITATSLVLMLHNLLIILINSMSHPI